MTRNLLQQLKGRGEIGKLELRGFVPLTNSYLEKSMISAILIGRVKRLTYKAFHLLFLSNPPHICIFSGVSFFLSFFLAHDQQTNQPTRNDRSITQPTKPDAAEWGGHRVVKKRTRTRERGPRRKMKNS